MYQVRGWLCAGVSTLALVSVSSQLHAQDQPKAPPRHGKAAYARAMPVKAIPLKAAPWTSVGTWTVWAEGGASWTGGNSIGYAVPPGFGSVYSTTHLGTGFGFDPKVGWQAAVGADYRFAGTPWHVSFGLRYGQSTADDQTIASRFVTGSSGSRLYSGQQSAGEKEYRTVADLMFGRDFGPAGQLKLGVRAAGLGAKLDNDANAALTVTSSSGAVTASGTALLSASERSHFVGVGPRAAYEGAIPLAATGWTLDYMGGLALLVGQRSLTISGSYSQSLTSGAGTANFGLGSAIMWPNLSETAVVPNVDVYVGVSRNIGAATTLGVGFRFDGYFNALKTVDAAGNIINANRFYYGPVASIRHQFGAPSGPAGQAFASAAPWTAGGTWTAWVEGGGFWTGGDSIGYAVPPGFNSVYARTGLATGFSFKPQVGGEGAIGADYRLAGTPWHVSFAVRYGESSADDQTIASSFRTGSSGSQLYTGQQAAGEKEYRAVADLMVGRDIAPMTQMKLGLRVAALGATVTNDASVSLSSSGSTSVAVVGTALLSASERSRFIGVGPRAAIEGSRPIGATPWTFEYMGGVALLVGQRSLDISGSYSQSFASGSGTAFGLGTAVMWPNLTDGTALVPNVDAYLGVSRIVAAGTKFGVGFRFDGYFNALKTVDAVGNVNNVNRFYYGPVASIKHQF